MKKFRDISRISISSKSAKTSLNQTNPKVVQKVKVKKPVNTNLKPEDTENQNQEEEQTACDEYTVEDEDDDEAEIIEEDE